MQQSKLRSGITVAALVVAIALLPLGGFAIKVVGQLDYVRDLNLRSLAKAADHVSELLQNAGTVYDNYEAGRQARAATAQESAAPDEDEPQATEREQKLSRFLNRAAAPASATPVTTQQSSATPDQPDERPVAGMPIEVAFGTGANRYVVDFVEILAELPANDALDVLLIADSGGNVLAQHSSRSGSSLVLKSLTGLTRTDGSDVTVDLRKTTDARVLLAGGTYDLLCQPFDVFRDGTSQGLAACGLLDANEAWAQALAVSPLLLGVLFSVIVFGVLLWPVLKVGLLSARERFRFSDLYFVLFGSWAALMTALVFTMAVATHLELADATRVSNEHIASQLNENLSRELLDLHREMLRLDNLAVDGAPETQLHLAADAQWRPNLVSDFELIFWMDPTNGQQITKASVWNTNTPIVNVGQREYFQRARDDRLWRLPIAADTPDAPETDARGFAQNVRSITTTEVRTIVSAKSSRCVQRTASRPELRDPAPGQACERAIVGAQARLISVTDPVLPPGVSFAVIDPAGRVIFHSDSRRTLKDNLYDELSDGDRLRAAVRAGVTRSITATYLGREHRVYVSPMTGFPWHVVVLADNEQPRTVVLEAVGHAMALAIPFVVVMLLLTLLYLAFAGQDLPRWFWPTHGSGAYHAWWSVALAVTFIMSAGGVVLSSADVTLAVATTLPPIIIAALLVASNDRRYQQLRGWAERTWPGAAAPGVCYVLASLLLWLNVTTIPAYGFYKNALAGSLAESAASRIVQLNDDLVQRDTLMRAYYQNVPSACPPEDQCECRRGDACTSDVYRAPIAQPGTEWGALITATEVSALWRALADVKPIYNDSTASRRYLAPAGSNAAVGAEAAPVARAMIPHLPNPTHPATVLISLAVLALGLGWLRYVCRKLYFLDIEPAHTLSVDEVMGTDRVVVAIVAADRDRLFNADGTGAVASRTAKRVADAGLQGAAMWHPPGSRES